MGLLQSNLAMMPSALKEDVRTLRKMGVGEHLIATILTTARTWGVSDERRRIEACLAGRYPPQPDSLERDNANQHYYIRPADLQKYMKDNIENG